VESGTGRNAQINGYTIAGKTGSTQLPYADITEGTKDQWFVGYTPNLVGAVWLGYDITDRNHYLKGRSGDTVVTIFRAIMSGALPHVEKMNFETKSVNQHLQEQQDNKSIKEKFDDFDEKMIKEAEKWKEKLEKGKGNLKKFEEKLKGIYKKFRH